MYESNSKEENIRTSILDKVILALDSRFGVRAKEVERFLKFAVVGIIGIMVDFGTVIILQATVLLPTAPNGEVIPRNVVIATSIAFLAALTSNLFWNQVWTYPDSRSRPMRRQLVQFTFISLVGWLARTVWIRVAFHPLGKLLMPLVLPLVHIFHQAASNRGTTGITPRWSSSAMRAAS